MSLQVPDFTPLAERYARARPAYPDQLFEHLAELVPGHELAWDVATGSGQAALGLARRFDRVIATDLSAGQIAHAIAHPRIDYRVATAENSGLAAGSVDLITVAAAAHWFDPPRFAAEARRVTRPGALLAAWTYHVGVVDPPFDEVFARFYFEILKPYFAPATSVVDERYATLDLPGAALETGASFAVEVDWTLAEACDFAGSWSGTQGYRDARGEDPVDRILAPALASLWSDPGLRLRLRWPLFLRLQRL